MLHFGIITDVDAAKGVARVRFPESDNIVSGWLPMSVPKIFKDKWSIPFDVNEPVWCIMDENCENGIIGGAYPNKKALPDGASSDKVRVKFAQSLSIEFDHSTGTLKIEGDGNIKIDIVGKVEVTATEVDITAPVSKFLGNVIVGGSLSAASISAAPGTGGATSGDGSMSIDGDIAVTGKIEATGDVKSGIVSLGTHRHGGVSTGSGSTSTPIP